MKVIYRFEDIALQIIKQQPDIVLQGCNCQNRMGAGVAKRLREVWGQVFDKDAEYSRLHRDFEKLGNFSKARINDNTLVYNLYTQLTPGPYFSIEAYKIVLYKLVFNLTVSTTMKRPFTIMMPRIGCGIATPEGRGSAELWKELEEYTVSYLTRWFADSVTLIIVGLPGDELIYNQLTDQDGQQQLEFTEDSGVQNKEDGPARGKDLESESSKASKPEKT